MYSMLEQVLMIDIGQELIYKYVDTMDAFKIIKELNYYYTSSIIAKERASKLLSQITASKWGRTKCFGSQQQFLQNWLNMICRYKINVGSRSALQDKIKRQILSKLFIKVPEINNIESIKAMTKAAGSRVFNYN